MNAKGIPSEKCIRRKTWDGKMVRRLSRNPLLMGMPGRGFTRTVKHHETGRRAAVKNPKGPTFRECPHLAHVDPDLFDEVNRLLDEANAGFGRKPVNGADPLRGRPKKRTRFPGQHARCWYCGRLFVWGGNGVSENLMCSGSREWKCWNSVGFSGSDAGATVAKTLREELERLEGFDAQFRGRVDEAGHRGGSDSERRHRELEREDAALAAKRVNLLRAIADYGSRPMFEEKLAELDDTQARLDRDRRELERLRGRAPVLPASVAELRQAFEEKFRDLAADSPGL